MDQPLKTNLRTARKHVGLTQMELSEQLGVSIATIRRWEAGDTSPTGSLLLKIAEICNVDPATLFIEPEPKQVSEDPSHRIVFQDGARRVELPPTPEGYVILEKLLTASHLLPDTDTEAHINNSSDKK